MAVKFEDRPLDKVREEVIDQLVMNYSHGELSQEAFEARLDHAFDSTTHQQLADLVEDLPLQVDAKYEQSKAARFDAHSTKIFAGSEHSIVAVLSSQSMKGAWQVPAKIKAYSVLGSLKIDFTDAHFESDEIHVQLLDLVGDIKIFVPEFARVTCNVANIISSLDNHLEAPVQEPKVHIHISGYSVLSSIDIKVRQTMRERFIAFADKLKRTWTA